MSAGTDGKRSSGNSPPMMRSCGWMPPGTECARIGHKNTALPGSGRAVNAQSNAKTKTKINTSGAHRSVSPCAKRCFSAEVMAEKERQCNGIRKRPTAAQAKAETASRKMRAAMPICEPPSLFLFSLYHFKLLVSIRR
nr:MAG TPA: hypothetical protein [Caudoviricetes sp.]